MTEQKKKSRKNTRKKKSNSGNSTQISIKSKLLSIFLVILWMAVIFIMSSHNGDTSSSDSGTITEFIVGILEKVRNDNVADRQQIYSIIDLVVRKAAHMTEYAILFLLVLNAVKKCSEGDGVIYNHVISVLVSFIYACTDEFHQLSVAGRAGRMTDVIIDMAGVVIAILLMNGFKSSKWKIIISVLLAILVVGFFVVMLFI